jgi:hypothetical protein
MEPAVNSDMVVGVRLLPLEVHVAMSVIRTPGTHWYKRFSLCSAPVTSWITLLS